MFRLGQIAVIRAVAKAALEQEKLTPRAYDGVVQWIDQVERQDADAMGQSAIRRASEVMIRRLQREEPSAWPAATFKVDKASAGFADLELGTP